MNNFNEYRNYEDYVHNNPSNLKQSMRNSQYTYQPRPRSNQNQNLYRPSTQTKYEPAQNNPLYKKYKLYARDQESGKRPPTPVYLREQSREELYNMQLKQSIGNKMTMQTKNLPSFPMMDDQTSLTSEAFGRPGSYRPGSATNPDFMLPRDVQFYYKNREKIFLKLEDFYGQEKKTIEEMMDECLKSIITLFEDHKQKLFEGLTADKTTFKKVFERFSDGVEDFLKTADTRLENNLKAYEERIMKIQEDEQNPLGTHIEKLRVEKEMINSKQNIIQEIKKSYELSNIPWDKQKIGELVIDQFKKKHSANVSNLAQHMQQMIGGLRTSLETFNNFKNYISLEIQKEKEPKNPRTIPNQEVNNFENLPTNIPPQMKGSNMSQQMMMQNMGQFGMNPQFMGNQEAYQMALMKQQLGNEYADPNYDPNLNSNYINKNFDGPIFRPHINGNFNLNINALHQAHQKKWSPVGGTALQNAHSRAIDFNNSDRSHNPHNKLPDNLPSNHGASGLRPTLKSPKRKMLDIEREEKRSEAILVNKKSVTFNLPEAEKQTSQVPHPEQETNINEVLKKYKQLNTDMETKEVKQERAKSPILEAKESIQKMNNFYDNSKHHMNQFHGSNLGMSPILGNNPQTSPFKNLREKKKINNYLEERGRLMSRDRSESLQSMNQLSATKGKFSRDLLKPRSRTNRKELKSEINRLGAKYSEIRKNRPVSHKINTLNSVKFLSKGSMR